MRVTDKQMLSLVTQRVATSSELFLKAQERVASMKLINRPSDDPIGMGRVLDFRRKLSSIDQYIRNIGSTRVRIESAVIYLEEVHELLGEAKSIAVSQSSQDDSLGRETAAREVTNIYNQILDIANTKLQGRYIFAGHETSTKPFTGCAAITCGTKESLTDGDYFTLDPGYYVWYDTDDDGNGDPGSSGIGIRVNVKDLTLAVAVADATMTAINAIAGGVFDATVPLDNLDKVEIVFDAGSYPDIVDVDTGFTTHNTKYVGDSGEVNIIVGEGTQVKINAHGNETFTGSGVTNGVDIFSVLKALKDALEKEPYDSDAIADQMTPLSNGITQIETVLSKQATTFTRLEQSKGHWEKLKQNFEKALSDTEDADVAQAVVELMAQQTAYEMALASAAGVLKRNLLDFLG